MDKYRHLRPPRPRTCFTQNRTPKIGYPDQHQAEGAALRARLRTGYTLTAYQCPHCNQWHIGRAKSPLPPPRTT